MASRSSFRDFVTIDNVEPTLRLMSFYGKTFAALVRKDVQDNVARPIAAAMQARAAASTPQSRAVAGSIKATRDRLPAIRAFGGAKARTSGGKATMGDIGFGANFGGGQRISWVRGVSPRGTPYNYQRHTTRQFGPWLGNNGDDRFIYPVIEDNRQLINDAWQNALDRVYKEWNRR